MGVHWNGERPADFRRWEEALREEIGDPASITLDAVGGGEWIVSRALVGWTSIRREARETLRSAGLPVLE
jgi:hypothetical protein